MGKLFWSAAAGLALGLAADSAGIKGKIAAIAVALWLLASLAWIVWPAMTSPLAAATALLPVVLARWVAFGRLPNRRENPTLPGAVLLALSLAIGGTALIGSSASLAQIALALAAATGGFLLWNWPVERHVWGVSGQIALGITVLIATVFTFFTSARAEILLLALPALLADRLYRRLPLPQTDAGRALGSAATTILALLPALAAIGAAYVLSGGESSPY
jgi:hypothetical protein